MKTKQFVIYSDPSHAWAKIPAGIISHLMLNHDLKISTYSHIRKKHFYLEEDLDLPGFIKKYESAFNTKVVFLEKHTNKQSKIRSYDRIYSSNINAMI